MSWREFSALLKNLPPESALMRRLASAAPRTQTGPAAAERFWNRMAGIG